MVVCVRVRPGKDPALACWQIEQQNNLMRATDAHPAIARRGGSYNDADESPLHANPELYTFRFDSLCTPRMTSDDLYTTKIAPIVRAAAEGYNATVFAYGQTGSGKTHTMSGAPDEPGIIPRAVEEIFDQIECVCIVQLTQGWS